jgi:dethiobiotin synthase
VPGVTGPDRPSVTWPRVVVITGTDTGVGKTVATAALAALLGGRLGRDVAVDKPTQTGITDGEEPDVEVVSRLGGVRVTAEGVRLGPAMAPVAAARRSGGTLPTLADHVERIAGQAQRHEHVLVEGAGGLLVELTDDTATLADLATGLRDRLGRRPWASSWCAAPAWKPQPPALTLRPCTGGRSGRRPGHRLVARGPGRHRGQQPRSGWRAAVPPAGGPPAGAGRARRRTVPAEAPGGHTGSDHPDW